MQLLPVGNADHSFAHRRVFCLRCGCRALGTELKAAVSVYLDGEPETLQIQAFSMDPAGTHKNHWGNKESVGGQEEEAGFWMSLGTDGTWGTWVAQSVKLSTLGFSLGRQLTVL